MSDSYKNMDSLLRFTINLILILCPGVFAYNISSLSNSTKHTRILGGRQAHLDESPWAIFIYQIHGSICSGSLIHAAWILSSAHCFYDEKDLRNLRAVAGEFNTNHFEGTEQTRYIDRIVRHPNFQRKYIKTQDIALMHVTQFFYENDFVKPVKLIYKGAILSGEGSLFSWGEGARHWRNVVLRHTEQKILRNFYCEQKDGSTTPYYIMCTISPYRNGTSCNGDSGAGLVQHTYLIGVLNSALYCRLPSDHVYFVRVPLYVEWIRKVTGEKL